MNLQPARLWEEAAKKLGRADAAVEFSPEQRQVLKHLQTHFPKLYLGIQYATLDNQSIAELSHLIGQGAPAAKKERFDFLCQGIDLGNRTLDWDVPLGPVFIAINREKSHLQPATFHRRGAGNELVAAVYRQLENPPPTECIEQLGQLLLSAVLFGGLLESAWHAPFLQAVIDQQYFQEGSWLWLELKHPKKAKMLARVQQRRWVADPLTQLLLYRFIDKRTLSEPDQKTPAPWKAISAYFKTFETTGLDLPTSLSELRRLADATQLLNLSPHLHDYAAGKPPATSVPIAAWLRLFTGKRIPVERNHPKEKTATKPKSPRITPSEAVSDRGQIEQHKELLRLLGPGASGAELSARRGRRLLHHFLQKHSETLSPALQLLVHWARQLLTERFSHRENRGRKPLKVSSVRRYLQEIGEALLRCCGPLNLLELEPQDFEVLYEAVAARREKNSYAINRLTQLHGFLQVFYGLPEMEWKGLMEEREQVTAAVDANLVSPRDYEVILRSLGWMTSNRTRWQTLHLLAVILAYRCGLRPAEIQSLRLIDIQGITEHEALVRNNRFSSVKTNAGIRRLPLSILLAEQELRFLLDFVRQRRLEDKLFGDGLLLAHPLKKSGMLSDSDLFGPIRAVIRRVTGDEAVRFYHLRHSFLTWLGCALSLNDEIETGGMDALDHQQFAPSGRRKLKIALMQEEFLGKKHQYLIALLAGHSSPKTTNRHYIHLSDWLLAYHLRHSSSLPKANHRLIMALTGYGRAMAFRVMQENQNQHPLVKTVKLQAEKHTDTLRHPLLTTATALKADRDRGQVSRLPDWESALELCLRKTVRNTGDTIFATILPHLKDKDWQLAVNIYETMRRLDGRNLKTALKVIRNAEQNFSLRWGGITYLTYAGARAMSDFLNRCGISKNQILIVHHPPRGQKKSDIDSYARKWAEEASLPLSQCLTGESANNKTSRRKGCITLKALSQSPGPASHRTPSISPGLCFAIQLLQNIITGGDQKPNASE